MSGEVSVKGLSQDKRAGQEGEKMEERARWATLQHWCRGENGPKRASGCRCHMEVEEKLEGAGGQ